MGGGIEFFTQNEDPVSCTKNYDSCVYTAQGSLMCNLKKKEVKETMVPGMSLGGLPNIGGLNLSGAWNDEKK
jgi:hypothetical protein